VKGSVEFFPPEGSQRKTTVPWLEGERLRRLAKLKDLWLVDGHRVCDERTVADGLDPVVCARQASLCKEDVM
jgi:hypothetical protein